MSEVLTHVERGVGGITLNRPQALHALTLNMCEKMIAALLEWRDDPAVQIIQISHSGERGFCAGGDIRMLAASAQNGGGEARRFFHTEYRLNHLLHAYGKPIIALIDGVTMGGGVGISMPATYRVATELTTFAMPETGIGLFPDVGGGWYLPRLPGKIGLWLAITGARLKAADCMLAKIATHYAPSSTLPELKLQIAASAQTSDPAAALQKAINALRHDPGPCKELTKDNLFHLNSVFDHERLEDILDAMTLSESDWIKTQLSALTSKSPQTIKVAHRQLREGAAAKTFADNMRMEYRIASRVVMLPDFEEGVRAVILDKDNAPKWSPAALQDVSSALIDAIFAPLPADQEWTPLI